MKVDHIKQPLVIRINDKDVSKDVVVVTATTAAAGHLVELDLTIGMDFVLWSEKKDVA